MVKKFYISALAALVVLFASQASSQTVYHQFVVKTVKDADTFSIDTRAYNFFPELEFSVRVYGIDTPEKGSRAKCAAEDALSKRATVFAKGLIVRSGNTVLLSRVKHDKYGGRFDAKVTLSDGTDFGQALIDRGYAKPYFGGKKESWCN